MISVARVVSVLLVQMELVPHLNVDPCAPQILIVFMQGIALLALLGFAPIPPVVLNAKSTRTVQRLPAQHVWRGSVPAQCVDLNANSMRTAAMPALASLAKLINALHLCPQRSATNIALVPPETTTNAHRIRVLIVTHLQLLAESVRHVDLLASWVPIATS
eukprot:TRINITY_DN15_c0_g1_i1.p3 TRINITY_DN15_c0_g1~~TRINITY_DN15_c0_g1_i1.p3  ORF type:complete len:161 (-),score=13.18 TRINITY_DN15_c0_g1_i1:301-783(-)